MSNEEKTSRRARGGAEGKKGKKMKTLLDSYAVASLLLFSLFILLFSFVKYLLAISLQLLLL